MSGDAATKSEDIQDSGGWMKYPMNAMGALGRAMEFADRMGQVIRYRTTDVVNPNLSMDFEDTAMILMGKDQDLVEKHGADLVGEDGSMSGSQQLSLAGWDKMESDTTGVAGATSFGRFLVAMALETAQDPLSLIEGGGGGRGVVAITKTVDASFEKGAVKVMKALNQVVPDPKTGRVTRDIVDLVDPDNLELKMMDDILAEVDKIRGTPQMKDASWNELVDAAAGVSRTIRTPGLDEAGELLRIPGTPDFEDVLHLGTKAKDDAVSYGVLNKMKDDLANISGRRNWHSKDDTWVAYLDRVAHGRGEDWTTGGIRFGVPFTDATSPIPGVTKLTRGAVSRVRSGIGSTKPFEAIKSTQGWTNFRENLLPKLGAERYERIAASRDWHGSYATYSQFVGAQDSADLIKRMYPLTGQQISLVGAGGAAETMLKKSLRNGGMSAADASKQTADIMSDAYAALADG